MILSHITRLAFGRAKPTGGEVQAWEWADFVTTTLSRSFPDGFTVLPATGGWRDRATGNTIHEASVIVEVAHDGSPEALAAVRSVATVYKTLFQQDAVMVSTVAAQVEFV